MLSDKRLLLIIGGGIAAYKMLDVIRRLRDEGARVTAVLTEAGARFVTPLSVASLTGNKPLGDLFSLTDESEMGHIRLSREADAILVAPATADLMAKMAAGLANDLASTVLLATDKPVFIAPSMNIRMWEHPATQRNLQRLRDDGIGVIDPESGALACGEEGAGRLAGTDIILQALGDFFTGGATVTPLAGSGRGLAGWRALVTAGPTREAIDPVRYIANRSSGKQGYAIARALADLGAGVVLVSGPTALAPPPGLTVIKVETARDMAAACEDALPADIVVCAAAVADWRPSLSQGEKIKKGGDDHPVLGLVENPDILATIAGRSRGRPGLVVGFAAETEKLLENARAKRRRKRCDWIVANDVSAKGGAMEGDSNRVHLITASGEESWPRADKDTVARRLAERIAGHFQDSDRGAA